MTYKRLYLKPETQARILLYRKDKESADETVKRLLDEIDAHKRAGDGPG